MKKKLYVVLDTNIFYAPMYFKIDFIKELLYKLNEFDVELLVPSSVVEEIKNLNDNFPKQYFEKYSKDIKIVNTSVRSTDESILELCKKLKESGNNVLACTADNRLRKILKDKKIPCALVNKDKQIIIK